MPFLAPEPLHFGARQASDTDRGQGFTDFIEFERLDDCRDLFHESLQFVVRQDVRTVDTEPG